MIFVLLTHLLKTIDPGIATQEAVLCSRGRNISSVQLLKL